MGLIRYGSPRGHTAWVLGGGAALALGGCSFLPPTLPDRPPVEEVVWLDQNWSDEARFWFHHATQGTSTLPLPYDWFIALEQPSLNIFRTPGLLSDPDYLARFGFISSPRGTDYAAAASEDTGRYGFRDGPGTFTVPYNPEAFPGNPGGLPVGFAITPGYIDPETGEDLPDQIGFTCAACHTGQMTYQGTNIRIDGGPATTDLGTFRKALGLSLAYTRFIPGRFDRFADRVLGPDHTQTEEQELRDRFNTLLKDQEEELEQMRTGLDGSIEEGFMRLDALNRIGTQVFYNDLKAASARGFDATVNIAPNTAPVNYPATWSTSWFDWVQYDASIEQPMVRNAGEALGVVARVNLANPDRTLYRSSVPLEEVFWMEELIAGPNPLEGTPGFKGLAAPAWPEDILGPIDRELAEQGQGLYVQHCQSCHLPAPNDPEGAFWTDAYWAPPNQYGLRVLNVPVIPLEFVGTDPAQAAVLKTRTVQVPEWLQIPEPQPVDGVFCTTPTSGSEQYTTDTSFAWALAVVTQHVIEAGYDEADVPPDRRRRLDGFRDNCVQAPNAYKARPLNGIWATAPFLHNGSVPSLEQLLIPADQRVDDFCLGSLEFDPDAVGYETTCGPGFTEIDATVAGNLNTGHSFEDGEGRGVIGPALSDADRAALVEYLKTL